MLTAIKESKYFMLSILNKNERFGDSKGIVPKAMSVVVCFYQKYKILVDCPTFNCFFDIHVDVNLAILLHS